MADASLEDLTISALNALASSPRGQMTIPDLVTHLETRQGPTDEEANDAQSPQSREFLSTVQGLVASEGRGSLIAHGYAVLDSTGGMVQITDGGRAFIGR